MLQQLTSGFERTINWNKYQSKVKNPYSYLDYLIDLSFQGVNRLFVLLIRNFFYQPVKNNLRAYDNIREIAAGQEDNYTAGFQLDYKYFVKCYKMTAIDFKQTKSTWCWSKNNTTN